MVSSARTPRSTTLNEQLLIMRLITSVGLALLLMLGLAATGHTEADGSTPVPLVISGFMDPHVEPVADAPVEHEEREGGEERKADDRDVEADPSEAFAGHLTAPPFSARNAR